MCLGWICSLDVYIDKWRPGLMKPTSASYFLYYTHSEAGSTDNLTSSHQTATDHEGVNPIRAHVPVLLCGIVHLHTISGMPILISPGKRDPHQGTNRPPALLRRPLAPAPCASPRVAGRSPSQQNHHGQGNARRCHRRSREAQSQLGKGLPTCARRLR